MQQKNRSFKLLFISEVDCFDIDDYIGHLGWHGQEVNLMKIYTRAGSSLFFLHDEMQNRMYAFKAADPSKLNSVAEFGCVVRLFQD